MLAIVEPALSIRGAVIYNEEKLTREQARFLDAHNFLQEKEDLTLREKLQRFGDLTVLNERSKKKCIHFSVNFPPSDELSDKEMKQIATEFMQAIDFGDQPWLLYRHTDVGHPHMHIVTTNIRPDGSRISNDLRSPHHLKQVCFQLEEKHHLHPVFEMPDLFGEHTKVTPAEETPGTRYLTPLVYGQKPTKTAIAETLEVINRTFAFTSFEAYNAILGLYHIRADRGREDSPMYQNRGMYYRLIDEKGRKLGAPIKASAFDLPVTLDKLEQKFVLSRRQALESVRSLQVHINYILLLKDKDFSLRLFSEELYREKILLVIPALTQRNPRGWQRRAASLLDDSRPAAERPVLKPDDGHGFFYVHLDRKTIIRDTDLAESCTAASILQRTGIEKDLRRLHDENYFKLSNAQNAILRPDYPDTAETRRLLLQLSPLHSRVVQQQLELKEEQKLTLRQSRRLHLHL
ncbi:MAG TPA: relaxase/mobilization nuclease domain-containing protein [Puia sp.]|nr:relaxase/mobilization nuclease domain-containing protein [Puia sp.]